MKTKLALAGLSVGLALLVGIFLANRPEKQVVQQSQHQPETAMGRKSYGGSFTIESVRISDTKQPPIRISQENK